MAALEIGTYVEWHAEPGEEGESAALLERQGFDIAIYPDSQSLFPEAFVRMALAVPRTSRIRLSPSVLNPVTRHPALAASAALAVHRESGGRALVGIGRGDSALATIGEGHPAPLDRFTRFAADLRAYLRGDPVDCGDGVMGEIRWRPAGLPPIPVDIACSGERVIRAAVRLADRVSFAVGSAPERLEWALGIARDELDRCGRSPSEVSFGAFLVVGAHADRLRARQVVQGAVATHAVFPTLGRPGATPVGAEHGGIPGEALAAAARASKVAGSAAPQLPEAFVDWFAVVGPPAEVTDRIRGVAALGLSHLYLVSHAPSTDRQLAQECRETLVAEVLPGLRTR